MNSYRSMKIENSINKILRKGLCTGCGTCVSLCPSGALKMELDQDSGTYLPQVDAEKCTRCGICLQVCPGHNVDFTNLNREIFGKLPENNLLGNYFGCFIGHAGEYDIRFDSASGGLVTAILIFALEQGIINGALVTRMDPEHPLRPQPFIARNRKEIIEASKSKYCPVPANVALKEILKAKEEEKFAVVGLPCQIQGVRKAELANKKLREKIVLHLGLVCSHTDSFKETEYIFRKYRIQKDKITKLDYRGQGWPGSMTIHSGDSWQKSIGLFEYIKVHNLCFYTPYRCILCGDFINRFADISFMDPWLPEIEASDKIGQTMILVRSPEGRKICDDSRDKKYIQLKTTTEKDVIRSQGRNRLSNKDLKAHFLLTRLLGRQTPEYNIALPASKPFNYLRAILRLFNIKISFNRYLSWLVNPLLSIESRVFQQLKSRM